METPRALPELAADLPFKFVGGRPSLDLLNTADWPSTGPARDRLSSYERFLEWGLEAGVLDPVAAGRLRKRAAADPSGAGRSLERCLELRRALHRTVVAIVAGRGVAAAADRLGPFLHEALPHLALEPGRAGAGGLRAGWSGLDASLDGPTWPVVWDAVQLFLSDEASRLRVCGGQDCGWVYVDRSRNGLRRWCEMETCGTTAKNRRRGRRPRGPSSGGGREDGTRV
jgi:predicted RNA-binding Zn ribbon-like protein